MTGKILKGESPALGQLIRQQAAILALNAFLFGAMMFILLAGVVWFLYPSYASKNREQALTRLSAEELMEQP